MLAIDAAEVRRIAELARIDLDDDSVETFSHQLQKILDYVAMLNEVEAKDVQHDPHLQLLEHAARADVEQPSLSRTEALRNSPESREGLFRVPRVLKPK